MSRNRGRAVRQLGSAILCVLMAAALGLVPLSPARSDTLSEKQEKAKQVKAQLQANQAELNRLTNALSQTESQLSAVEMLIDRNQAELAEAEAELARYQGILSQRVRAMYMEGNASSLEVMLDSTSFTDFLNSYDYMRFIGDYDTGMIDAARGLTGQIQEKRAGLEASRAQYQAQAASQASQRAAIQAKLAEQQSIISSLDSEISALVSQQVAASTARSGGSSGSSRSGGGYWSVGPVDGMYFPVAGPHSFSNGWLAPRRGHLHQGCDIIANYGVPCVAITSGNIVQRQGGGAGNYILLYGDNGDLYYYMHLQSYAASGHVAAGQVIAYVGDTGSPGMPHLHFEVHPGGGAAVNPYPLLCALDGR